MWQALLVIDSDPLAVYDALAAQARQVGIKFPSSGDTRGSFAGGGEACALSVESPQVADGPRFVPLASLNPSNADALVCGGIGEGLVEGQAVSATVTLHWGDSTHHALLTVVHHRELTGFDIVDADGSELASPATLPPISESPQKEPRDFIGTATNAISPEGSFSVEKGSKIAADVPGLYGDFVAVLYVTGDPKKVLTNYAQQVGREPGLVGEDNRPPTVRRLKVPATGKRVLHFAGGPHDGGFTEFVASPNGQWIFLYAASD